MKVYTYTRNHLDYAHSGHRFEACSGYFKDDTDAMCAARTIFGIRRIGKNGKDVMQLVAEHCWSLREPAEFVVLHRTIRIIPRFTTIDTTSTHMKELKTMCNAACRHYMFTSELYYLVKEKYHHLAEIIFIDTFNVQDRRCQVLLEKHGRIHYELTL